MKLLTVFLRALLAAAPLLAADPRNQPRILLQFILEDTPATVAKKFGRPDSVAELSGYRMWHYRLTLTPDSLDYSHTVCFRTTDGKPISVTRTSPTDEDVDFLFPDGTCAAHYWRDGAKELRVRVRRLSGERLLIAMGSPKPGMPAAQLMLIRREALEHFLPWLAAQLAESETHR
jgi:hypothetical protein